MVQEAGDVEGQKGPERQFGDRALGQRRRMAFISFFSSEVSVHLVSESSFDVTASGVGGSMAVVSLDCLVQMLLCGLAGGRCGGQCMEQQREHVQLKLYTPQYKSFTVACIHVHFRCRA